MLVRGYFDEKLYIGGYINEKSLRITVILGVYLQLLQKLIDIFKYILIDHMFHHILFCSISLVNQLCIVFRKANPCGQDHIMTKM